MNYDSHPKMKYIYIGVDCHKFTHTATIINCFNEKLETVTFNKDTKGFEYLIKTVEKYRGNLISVYGLEDTKHLGYYLASYLLSKNLLVKNVNSNLTYVERKKNPIITKNDELDSACVAKVLLDELDSLPNAASNEIYWTLKQLVKMRKVFITNNSNLKHKLHAQLMHHYPNYNLMFKKIDGSTALALFEKYPSPDLIANESSENLTEFILKASKGKLGLKKSEQILNLIQEYNIPYQVYQTERNTIIKILIKQMKENNTRIESINNEIFALYDKIGKKIHTFPCLDKISSACMLAEIGNIDRFLNSGKLARYSGIAPIEKSSGNTEKAIKNEFGNRELNCMFYKLACRSLSTGRTGDTPFNSIFKEYYHKKLKEGKNKHQAIICIMRRLVNIIFFILKNDIEYIAPTDLVEQCNISFRERKQEIEEKLSRKKKFCKAQ